MRLRFDKFILAEESFAQPFRSLKICILVKNNLDRKLVSSLESLTTLNESFEVSPAPLFILAFNLLSYELDNFMFTVLY